MPGELAGVRDVRRDFHHAGDGHLRILDLQVAVFESGVAQAKPERQQRRGGQINILRQFGATGVFPVVVNRNLSHIARESHRQFSSGIVVAEKNVADRVAAFHAGMPREQNGGHIFQRPINRQRTTSEENDHHRLAGLLDRFQQIVLVTGQIQTAPAVRFAVVRVAFAHGHEHDVRVVGRCDGSGEIVRAFAIGLAAFDVIDFTTVTQGFLEALQQRHGVFGACARRPRSEHDLAVIRQRSDQGDGLHRFRQRQKLAFVSQKHHGLARGLAGHGAMLRREHHFVLQFWINVRMIK